jgi:DNA-binding XRE family transcriptional regulator
MIYFLKDENNYVKIGFSTDVIKRIYHLRTSSPYKSDVLLIIKGDYSLEQELHKKFKDSLKSGEWFLFSKEIESFINDNQKNNLCWEFGFTDENNINIDLNNKLKTERLRQGLSLANLGDILGIRPQSVYDFELSELHQRISLKMMVKVAKALGKEFQYRLK